ncbi:MAG: GntP family permease [Spirochaetes bacterium]|nr:GntP family permease [Spirochaetota bacterium]
MVSGGLALFLLLVAVIVIIVLTAKYKMNAFVVLIGVAFLYGIAIGMPLKDVVAHVRTGFGNTLGAIGIVIVCGTIMGYILEKTGAALSMTQAILKVVGRDRSAFAMSIAGYVVSIPVFCDSGYVILTPLNKALAKETKTSMAVMAVALSTGLYATHTMVPPTPGPIAAAGALKADLGLVILLGMIAAVPAMIAGYLWAKKVAQKYWIEADIETSYEELIKQQGKLPNTVMSFLPLVVPIVLILLKSIAEFPTKPFGGGGFAAFISFIGDPVTALMIGVILSLFLVPKHSLRTAYHEWMGHGIRDAAIILVITAAGGSFGRILQQSPMVEFIKANLSGMHLGMLMPFIIAAALKTAQGSSTVAIITTSAIMAPLLGTLGLDPALTVIAIGAGSMVVSHANDSYFWVVSQFSNMEVSVAYKIYTSATLVEGIVGIMAVMIMSIFI